MQNPNLYFSIIIICNFYWCTSVFLFSMHYKQFTISLKMDGCNKQVRRWINTILLKFKLGRNLVFRQSSEVHSYCGNSVNCILWDPWDQRHHCMIIRCLKDKAFQSIDEFLNNYENILFTNFSQIRIRNSNGTILLLPWCSMNSVSFFQSYAKKECLNYLYMGKICFVYVNPIPKICQI